ncbi:5-(carboxyamino)imidazole ribonucleotide synthase [Bacillus aquiflavi]|uniref:N5-carboxyaminoimidazole ribonucleotide synthase n=1 Tax=Bacillus aquiflavi TaxID=2672567 RepID=A0A7W2AGA7_9BACI|nr:5-(carboxyamino)imidazole ribonucleotide synthase [Bacillus aquiflavi]MBA4538231.1 5-(carboxyamino)imidazole ribonucleotide synthase [Bacillus aquiflavi]UAC49907.1 5-(carboxyamino)imidazole ribonucleotide synthase [Bacillus aquiflavi]
MSLSNKVILPGSTIGIIGGGQLGRMMALAAKAQGFKIAVLEPTANSPCGQVADVEIISAYDDLEAIQKLSEICDVITYEFENIDSYALRKLYEHAYVPQGTALLEMTQDRLREKEAIEKAGLTVAPYARIEKVDNIHENIEKLSYPAVLKTTRGGYDGKGQFVIKSKEDIASAGNLLKNGVCVLEKWIPFEKEISVIIARNPNGETAVFPVAENIHRDNILHETIVPARISETATEKAIGMALQLAESLQFIGTLAVEMFLTKDETIYINELAPRPHNSGHYTIEACETSQFEQHIRAVCNWPLGCTELLKPAVMVNVLGEHQSKLIDKIPELIDWKIHLYGKKEAKQKRKMGHATLLRDNVEMALSEIDQSFIWEKGSEVKS